MLRNLFIKFKIQIWNLVDSLNNITINKNSYSGVHIILDYKNYIVLLSGVILFKLYKTLNFDYEIFISIISFVVFFYLYFYVWDNTNNFSNNIFIRIFQKTLVYIITVIFLIFLFIFLDFESFTGYFNHYNYLIGENDVSDSSTNLNTNNNSITETYTKNKTSDTKELVNINQKTDGINNENYTFSINKNLLDKSLEVVGEATKAVVPQLGAFAAAGTVGAAVIKTTAGLPPIQRGVALAGSTFITSTSTKLGLEMANNIANNLSVATDIKKSKHSNPNIDNIPSPDNEFCAFNPLEIGDLKSPLENLITYSFIFNIFIIFLIVSLLILIFQRYILSYNFNYILNIIEKYFPTKLGEWFKQTIKTSNNYSDKFLLFMFMFNSISLIFILLMNIFLISELLVNIDDYVEVYNYLHNKK
jgi:hypothetical protein